MSGMYIAPNVCEQDDPEPAYPAQQYSWQGPLTLTAQYWTLYFVTVVALHKVCQRTCNCVHNIIGIANV